MSLTRAASVLARCCMALSAIGSAPCALAAEWMSPQQVEIAPGIYQFITPDVAGNVDANSVAVIGERDILVFDSNLLPSTARNALTLLRKITDKPVRYLVNSHWHPDHTGGNELYAQEFPDLEIIATRDTRRLMEDTMKVYVKTLEFEAAQANQQISQELKTGMSAERKPLSPADRTDLQSQLQLEERFLTEYRAEHLQLPTLTFVDTLTLYHGGRELRFMHLAGHTIGDLALYLPAEKLLLTGDLLAYPVPFCADSHPSAWIASLETLSRLDATIIVPGHGQALHDQSYLQLVLRSLRSVQGQVQQALRGGMSLQETQKAVNLDAIRVQFTHNDPDLNAAFEGNFSPIVRQMYDEATEGLELYQ
jgi:cyclase